MNLKATSFKSGLILAFLTLVLTIFDAWLTLPIVWPKTLSALFGVLLAIWWVAHGVKFKIRKGAEQWLVLLLVSVTLIEVIRFVSAGSISVAYFFQWFQILVFLYILLQLSQDPRSFRYFWLALLIVSLLMLSLSSFGILRAEIGGLARSGFSGVNLNRQAYWYCLATLFFQWALIERFGKAKVFEVIGITAVVAILIFAIFRTASRGAFGSFLAGSATLMVLQFRGRNLGAYVQILPVFLLLLAFALVSNEILLSRIQGTFEQTEDMSRNEIWDAAVELFKENPIIGFGPAFQTEIGIRTGLREISTHQTLLQLLVSYGIIGFLIFFALVLSILKRLWRIRRSPLGNLYLSVFAATFVFALVSDLMFNRFFSVVLVLSATAPCHSRFFGNGLPGIWTFLFKGAGREKPTQIFRREFRVR